MLNFLLLDHWFWMLATVFKTFQSTAFNTFYSEIITLCFPKHLGHSFNAIFVLISNLGQNTKAFHQLFIMTVLTSSTCLRLWFHIFVIDFTNIGLSFVHIAFSAQCILGTGTWIFSPFRILYMSDQRMTFLLCLKSLRSTHSSLYQPSWRCHWWELQKKFEMVSEAIFYHRKKNQSAWCWVVCLSPELRQY